MLRRSLRLPSLSNQSALLQPRAGVLMLLLAGGGCNGSDGTEPATQPSSPERRPSDSKDPENHRPEFGGVMAAKVLDDSDVELSWEPGRDTETEENRLVYLVYLGEGDLPVSLALPFATTLPGATVHTIKGLPPGKFRFVVRVADEEGSVDTNTASVRATLGDHEPPVFAGVTGVVPVSAAEALVEWKPGVDNSSRYEFLRYQVFVGGSRKNLFDREPFVTSRGATSFLAPLTDSAKNIYVGVRALDEADNVDENKRITSTESLENEPPEFAGLTGATPTNEGVELRWSPAIDNATASSQIVYRIYVSERSGGQDFLRPYVTTPPGFTLHTVTGLQAETEYYFVVHAQDLAGNRDKNAIQLSVTTLPADETPPDFGGLVDATSFTPTSVTLSWDHAADARSKTEDIVYEVFLASTSGEQKFSRPHAVTPPGRTSWVLRGLEPETEYFAVVRARDESQQRDKNKLELSFTTGKLSSDSESPKLAPQGVRVRTALSQPGWLEVFWDGATDDQSGQVRGYICVQEDATACDGDAFFEGLNITTPFGINSAFVTNLHPRTEYWVSVRLEDENGNIMSSSVLESGITATSYQMNVEPLLQSRCNQCHEHEHNYSYGTLVNIPSGYEDLYLINPSSAPNSYLLRTLRMSGDESPPFSPDVPATHEVQRMPSDGTEFFTVEQESIFLDWLAQGAFNN